jgi:hypothetical protein
VWSYISTSPYVLIVQRLIKNRGNFTLTLILLQDQGKLYFNVNTVAGQPTGSMKENTKYTYGPQVATHINDTLTAIESAGVSVGHYFCTYNSYL